MPEQTGGASDGDVAQCVAVPPRRSRSNEEGVMREIVAARLRELWPTARIIHEPSLRYSSNRLDMAAVTETEINAVEIKSSRDVPDRLEAQLRGFAPICSRIIVALAPKWNVKLPSLERPLRHGGIGYFPQRTEVQEIIHSVAETHIATWTVCANTGTIEVTDSGYSSNEHPWAHRMLHILHVAELAEITREHCIAWHGSSHWNLVSVCCAGMTGKQIKRAVCKALRKRAAFAAGSDAPIANTPPQPQERRELPHA